MTNNILSLTDPNTGTSTGSTTLSSSAISPTLLRMYSQRQVLLPTDLSSSELNFLNIFYPNNSSEIYNILNSIFNDVQNNTTTLINSSLNLAVIYNTYVNTVQNQNTNVWSVSANNVFEYIFIYWLQQKVISWIINQSTTQLT